MQSLIRTVGGETDLENPVTERENGMLRCVDLLFQMVLIFVGSVEGISVAAYSEL